jgi:hypothetical protein
MDLHPLITICAALGAVLWAYIALARSDAGMSIWIPCILATVMAILAVVNALKL